MNIKFQSMQVPCDFNLAQFNIVCTAINYFGDGDHPKADTKTLPHFTVHYVIRCLTKFHNETGSELEAGSILTALDIIKNAINHNRQVRDYTNDGHREQLRGIKTNSLLKNQAE